MILTAHFEDGTTQDFECPDWARWVEYECIAYRVCVWDKKPERVDYAGESHPRQFSGFQPNYGRCKFVGSLRLDQQKGHKLQLQKIEFIDE